MSEIHYHRHYHGIPPASYSESINANIDKLMGLVNLLLTNQKKIMLDVTALQTAVANETTLDQSVITLLNTLASELQAANDAGDQTTINSIVATMQQNATALAAAVAANTPAPAAPVAAPVAAPASEAPAAPASEAPAAPASEAQAEPAPVAAPASEAPAAPTA